MAKFLAKPIKEYKYRASFGSSLRCVGEEDPNSKQLTIASLDDLRKMVPEYASVDGYQDLLPVVANACVINYANLRDDIVDTATALKVYQCFANKFMNIEHDRKTIVGHWVGAGFSKYHPEYRFGRGSEPLDKETVASMTEPFNISLAGFVYSVAYPSIAKEIISSNDPNSPAYMGVSVSWELAFDDHKIALGNTRNLADCEIISDPAQIEALNPYLKCKGGKGVIPDGRFAFRYITDGVVPLGAGLTYSPAGHVQGIVVATNEIGTVSDDETLASKKSEVAFAEIVTDDKKNKELTKKVSLASGKDVRTNSNMKSLKNLADISSLTDENVKEFTLANMGTIIEQAIKDGSAKFESDAKAEKTRAEKAETDAKTALASVTNLEKEVKGLKDAEASRLATEEFNTRMSALDESFELTPKQRQAIANQIKGLDKPSFDSWKTNSFEAFATPKVKQETAASTVATVAPVAPVVVVETPKEVATAALAAAAVVAAPVVQIAQPAISITDALKTAFSIEKGGGITITSGRAR